MKMVKRKAVGNQGTVKKNVDECDGDLTELQLMQEMLAYLNDLHPRHFGRYHIPSLVVVEDKFFRVRTSRIHVFIL